MDKELFDDTLQGLQEALDYVKDDKTKKIVESKITSQYMGKMFGGLTDDKRKPNLSIRLIRLWRRIKDKHYDIKHSIRNHFKWHKTMCELRSWEASHVLLALGLAEKQAESSIRISYGKYNTFDEIDIIIKTICDAYYKIKAIQ